MATRQYIGAKYVPTFAQPFQWDATKNYEPLTVVEYLNASYTSKRAVPAGINPNNAEYWAQTGNYSAQVEQYRQEVAENTEAFQQMSAEFDQTQAEFEKINDDYNTIRAEYGPLKNRVAENERNIATLQADTTAHGKEITDLQNKAKTASDEIAGLKVVDTSLAGDISSINTELGKTNAEVASAKDRIDNLETDTTELQNITAQHTTDITDINQTVSAHTEDISENRTGIATNKQDIGNLTTRMSAVESVSAEHTDSINTLTSGLATANANIANNRANIEANASAITALETRATNNETAIAGNTAEINRIDGEVKENSENIHGNRTAISTLSERVANIDTSLTQAQQNINTLETQVNTINSTIADHNNQLNTQAGEIAELDANITQLDAKVLSSANVLLNGAKGDGVTDDTAAVQATINKYHIAVFPWTSDGYLLGAITIPNRTAIIGLGYPTLIATTDTLFVGATDLCVSGINVSTNYNNITKFLYFPETFSNIKILNSKFTGNGIGISSAEGKIIKDIEISGCFFNTPINANLTGATNVYFNYCTFSGSGDYALYLSNIGGLKINNSELKYAGDSIRASGSSIIIENCYFSDVTNYGYVSITDQNTSGLHIKDCIFNTVNHCLSLSNVAGLVLKNCNFNNHPEHYAELTNVINGIITGLQMHYSASNAFLISTGRDICISECVGGSFPEDFVSAHSEVTQVLITGNNVNLASGKQIAIGPSIAHGNMINGTWIE